MYIKIGYMVNGRVWIGMDNDFHNQTNKNLRFLNTFY